MRLRIDGSLNEIAPPPLSMYLAIVSRIKVLAKMDIAEKRVPQDGAIALRTDNRRVDMRVNTCPTVHGEKVVMRVLDPDPAGWSARAALHAALARHLEVLHVELPEGTDPASIDVDILRSSLACVII